MSSPVLAEDAVWEETDAQQEIRDGESHQPYVDRALCAIHGRGLQSLAAQRQQREGVTDYTEDAYDGYDFRTKEGTHVLHGQQVETGDLRRVVDHRTSVTVELTHTGYVVVGHVERGVVVTADGRKTLHVLHRLPGTKNHRWLSFWPAAAE